MFYCPEGRVTAQVYFFWFGSTAVHHGSYRRLFEDEQCQIKSELLDTPVVAFWSGILDPVCSEKWLGSPRPQEGTRTKMLRERVVGSNISSFR